MHIIKYRQSYKSITHSWLHNIYIHSCHNTTMFRILMDLEVLLGMDKFRIGSGLDRTPLGFGSI